MSLRDEIEEEIRFALSENPGVQRAFSEGGKVQSSPQEVIHLLILQYNSAREAILRLADEIDKLRAS